MKDDDAALLCVSGLNKLHSEQQAAKRITGPKYLLSKQAMVDEEHAEEMRERADEVIAMDYDTRLFY